MKYTIGIDLGGTNIVAGLVDEQYHLLDKAAVKTQPEKGFDFITDNMARLVATLLQRAKLAPADVSSIGIGSPGTPDKETGDIVFSNNLNWHNVPLASSVQGKTGIRTVVANDADCAALGEFVAGAGAEDASMALITIGTGVGSGIVMDGKLFCPAGSNAPELGHTTLICGGEPCTCGRNGCAEAYISFTALIRDGNRAADAHPDSMLAKLRSEGQALNGKNIFDCGKAGDPAAKELMDRFIEYMGQFLANVGNGFGVRAIVVGGGISKEGEWLCRRLREIVVREMFVGEMFAPPIRMATLGNDAGVIGAAALERYR